MKFMIWPAWAMPSESSAATYEPSSAMDLLSQGSRQTTTRIEPR
ncbi:hypothetical protein STENM223S_05991 [Streptomyces tendae]